MNFLMNLAVLFAASAIGSTCSFGVAVLRLANPIVRKIAVATIITCVAALAFFIFPDNAFWTWGIIVGFIGGLFALSMCIVSGDAESRACIYNNNMKGCHDVE